MVDYTIDLEDVEIDIEVEGFFDMMNESDKDVMLKLLTEEKWNMSVEEVDEIIKKIRFSLRGLFPNAFNLPEK